MNLVKKILKFHLEKGERVFAFGSRITGLRLKEHSDLDLCIRGEREVPGKGLTALRDFFAVSDLSVSFDICDWHSITPQFRAIIHAHNEEIVF